MAGWSIPNQARQHKAAQRRERILAVFEPSIPRKVAAYRAGVPIRTLNRYLRDAR